ncbi:MAG: hydrogenase formation protein HypD [Eubacteriales bacterium]|nr:hydrogenase formation protein HypD [Eubacteriales bacterium]
MPESKALLQAIQAVDVPPVTLMEVCGTHTMAIAKAGLKPLLAPKVTLLSGPGCPVCVTPARDIDACLTLSARPDVILTSYGDMLRVPGSARGDSLLKRRALGADVRMVYSPMDAVEVARENPCKKIVFLGVGFETTAPGTAIAVQTAKESGVKNFYLLPMLKRLEPALRALAASADFAVDGLLCPGHVASILGENGFQYVARSLRLPAVIAGFETEDVLLAVYRLLLQIREGAPALENAYPRAVQREGNTLAMATVETVFTPCDSLWRGMGMIPQSGLALKEDYAAFDAIKALDVCFEEEKPSACRCGDVIRGALPPEKCPLFGVCTPEDPIGPCMVSGEGACAARYKYGGSV